MTRVNEIYIRTVLFVVCVGWAVGAFAHSGHTQPVPVSTAATATAQAPPVGPLYLQPAQNLGQTPPTSGQGNLQFRVLYTGAHLPEAAVRVLEDAHGGFAIDRRKGRNEVYFALPGAGIVRLSADLRKARMLHTDPTMKDENMHNAAVWYRDNGKAYLSFPADDAGKVFTTTLRGKLLHTLTTPGTSARFDEPTADAYFREGEDFVPTDIEYLRGMFYITTGYSDLDFVLTAQLGGGSHPKLEWNDLAFGGRGEGPGQFGTGHGITVSPDQTRIMVSDRPRGEIDAFTRFGQYRDTINLPEGAWPCDVDYLAGYAVVGCLYGPDREKGAPIYILRDGQVVSTVWPKEELGLEKFQHLHNAVLHQVDGKLYIIAQAWNPGDFAVLEQVVTD